MDGSMECYGGGSIFGAILGTIIAIALLGVLAWWIYKKYYLKHQKDTKLVPDDDPENAKHEFAFDNLAFKGDGNKSLPLNANWTSPKNATMNNDKRKPLDDSYAGMPAPRMVSLKGSDFTGLGIECYGGLKDGIYVKKVAPQGPASGHINIGDRIMSLTIDFRHIVQEDAMTILSYASPYNVQLELVNGNNKLRSSGSSKNGMETSSPKPGRQSPLVHPLARSSSQSDLNTIERNSRKKLYHNNEDKDYPTLKMDQKEAANASTTIEIMHENEKKTSPSLMQQFRNQIAKIEEKFQTRSHKMQDAATVNMEEGKVDMMKKEDEIMTEAESQQQQSQSSPKKGLKFGIRVFPPNVNEKLFGKSRAKSNSPTPPPMQPSSMEEPKAKEEAVVDETDGGSKIKTEVTIECENFNRQNSVTSSGIKRDINGIPQELPDFMMNAANAAKDGRDEMRKSKGKAPRPPMVSVDLDASTETMDTNLNTTVDSSSESIANMNANNTNNANMEIEDELDRITEKYLSQSKDKLNFSDNFNSTAGSVAAFFDKIEELKTDDIENNSSSNDDEMRMRPSNSSTPKSDRKQAVANDLNNSFALDSSDLDLSNYGNNRQELNSSDITVHQANENNVNDVQNDESARRAASLGDLSLVKKSQTEKDGSASMERAQSLDIHENGMMPKQSLAFGLSKPTADLTIINGDDTQNGYEIDTNIPDDLKVIRYPFGEPKSDVLKTILGGAANALKSEVTEVETSTAPSIVVMNGLTTATADENVPMTINKSVVTIANNIEKMNGDMEALSLDVMEQPVSLTLVNNTVINDDPNHISPVFSSDNFGVNSIKISSAMMDVVAPSKTIIKNDGYFVKDNVVTITTTDSQPSSIQFIDDVKLDFNMQVLDDFEREERAAMKDDFKPKIVEAEIKEKKPDMNGLDMEINNNISKTTIEHITNQQQMNRFLTEIVFKGDDSAIEDMTTSEETNLTSSTVSNASSESSSPNIMTSTKTLTLTNVPLSTANFIKHERKQIEKNFVPQQKSEIKFTTAVYDNNHQQNNNNNREPAKRLSQIEQIRQNFEKSANENAHPIPVARKSSGGLSNSSPSKTTPSKIPVFSKKTSPTNDHKRSRTTSSSNSNKMSSSSDSVG